MATIIRLRRDAIEGNLNDLLEFAHPGDHMVITVFGTTTDVVVTELTDRWVEFRNRP
jgi:hypothetical protein